MTKKIPVRQCTGCGEHKSKFDLVRIVRSPDGVISVDPIGKASGRGAYICRDLKCLELCIKKKRLENCFGVPVENDIYEMLKKELSSFE